MPERRRGDQAGGRVDGQDSSKGSSSTSSTSPYTHSRPYSFESAGHGHVRRVGNPLGIVVGLVTFLDCHREREAVRSSHLTMIARVLAWPMGRTCRDRSVDFGRGLPRRGGESTDDDTAKAGCNRSTGHAAGCHDRRGKLGSGVTPERRSGSRPSYAATCSLAAPTMAGAGVDGRSR